MPFLGEVFALLTAAMWSGSSIAFAAATSRLGSSQVNMTRLLLATVYLCVVVVVAGLDLRLSGTQLVSLGCSGIVGLALGDTFLFRAYREIGPRITMMVMAIAPAIAAFLAYLFLGESLATGGVLGIGITLLGIMIVVVDPRGQHAVKVSGIGLFFAFLAAVGQGAGLILAKLAFLEGPVNGFVAALTRIVASLILLVPVFVATGRWRNPALLLQRDRKGALLTVLGSILGPFFGISLSLMAVQHTSVGIASTLMATVPIMMLPLVRVVQKESISLRAVLGAVVAVGGVALLFLR